MKIFKVANLSKKVYSSFAAVAVLASLLAFAPPVRADHLDDPEIDKVKDRGRKSVTLRIEDERFKSDKVRIKVTVTDKATGKEIVKHFTEKLDKEGKETIRVGGLEPGTEYRFKVRVKELGDKHYKRSDSKTIRTRAL